MPHHGVSSHITNPLSLSSTWRGNTAWGWLWCLPDRILLPAHVSPLRHDALTSVGWLALCPFLCVKLLGVLGTLMFMIQFIFIIFWIVFLVFISSCFCYHHQKSISCCLYQVRKRGMKEGGGRVYRSESGWRKSIWTRGIKREEIVQVIGNLNCCKAPGVVRIAGGVLKYIEAVND